MGRSKGVVYPSELLHGLLAMDDDGKPRYTRSDLEKIVEDENSVPALVIAARWRVGYIHVLRDTFLTSVKHLPLDVLKRIAGHSDVATTFKSYISATDRDADAVRAAFACGGMTKSQTAVGE